MKSRQSLSVGFLLPITVYFRLSPTSGRIRGKKPLISNEELIGVGPRSGTRYDVSCHSFPPSISELADGYSWRKDSTGSSFAA